MHSVTIQPSGHQFQVEDGEAVLAAALRQGFVLPYGCKNGACGSCKGKILSGTVDYGVYQQKALPDEEKVQGKALFCQAKPLTDLLIEARLVRKHQFGTTQAQFEKAHSYRQHDHVICDVCGKVQEFCDPRIQSVRNTVAEVLATRPISL